MSHNYNEHDFVFKVKRYPEGMDFMMRLMGYSLEIKEKSITISEYWIPNYKAKMYFENVIIPIKYKKI